MKLDLKAFDTDFDPCAKRPGPIGPSSAETAQAHVKDHQAATSMFTLLGGFI